MKKTWNLAQGLFLIFTVAGLVLGNFVAATAGESDIRLMLDGKELVMKQPPLLRNGRVFVYFRGIAEELDAVVGWDEATGTVTMSNAQNKIEFALEQGNTYINGRKVDFDAKPFVTGDGNTMVPLRFVSETLGIDVEWRENTVYLLSNKTEGSFDKSDLAIEIEGGTWALLEDGKPLIELVGDNFEIFESISCAYDGMDRLYSNEDLSVVTLPINGEDSELIDEIFLTSPKYSTSKGIRVGDSIEAVTEAYGSDYTLQNDTLTYWAGEVDGLKTPRLYFEIDNGKVITLGIYGARNAG